MRKEFCRVKGRRTGTDRRPFEAVLSRATVLYAIRNNDGSLYALIDGPLGEVNLTPLTYAQDGEEREFFFEWLTEKCKSDAGAK